MSLASVEVEADVVLMTGNAAALIIQLLNQIPAGP